MCRVRSTVATKSVFQSSGCTTIELHDTAFGKINRGHMSKWRGRNGEVEGGREGGRIPWAGAWEQQRENLPWKRGNVFHSRVTARGKKLWCAFREGRREGKRGGGRERGREGLKEGGREGGREGLKEGGYPGLGLGGLRQIVTPLVRVPLV